MNLFADVCGPLSMIWFATLSRRRNTAPAKLARIMFGVRSFNEQRLPIREAIAREVER